jgi:hypothetical protein
MADWLPSLSPVIAEIRAAGHLSAVAMASEFNARGIRAFRGGPRSSQQVGKALKQMREHHIKYERTRR